MSPRHGRGKKIQKENRDSKVGVSGKVLVPIHPLLHVGLRTGEGENREKIEINKMRDFKFPDVLDV